MPTAPATRTAAADPARPAGTGRSTVPLAAPGETRARLLHAALLAFATRGYDGTSLDGLATGLGVTKQTVLHHFGSKEGLLEAVTLHAAAQLAEAVDQALARVPVGGDRLGAVVRAVFSLTGRRPELLGFVREVGRRGPEHLVRLAEALRPLLERATGFLRAEVDVRGSGADRVDPQVLVLSAYAFVLATATEIEVLRSLGIEPSGRLLVRRRRQLLDELRAMGRPGVR